MLAVLPDPHALAAPRPLRRTPGRMPRGPQTRVRGFFAQSADCTYRSRRVARRRPSGKLASVRRLASDAGFYLFDGIDHPLRIKLNVPTAVTAYYELDLAGNVRGLRASGGASLGDYRYSAFGQTLEDTTSITQPLRWKARWWSPVAGGTYHVRAREWSPELGVFLSVDEFNMHDPRSTLWGWPGMNPIRFRDPMGRGYLSPEECAIFAIGVAASCMVLTGNILICGPLGAAALKACNDGSYPPPTDPEPNKCP